jgi:16S rRNA (guanine527-N7)-methyltransferase
VTRGSGMGKDRGSRDPRTGTGSPVPDPVTGAPEPPPEAVEVFGDTLPRARGYADLLATTGISHGLVGPREAPRLWERHLVNCALLEPLLERGSTVVDIGSGAGLPGVVLAIARPDLQVHLVEPLLRRTTWLESAIAQLGLDNVTVHRGRAEEMTLTAPVVTARAVASLDKLVAWSFPLLLPSGRLLALKGEAAATELQEAQPMLTAHGVEHSAVHVLGEDRVSEPIRVVEIVRPMQWQAPARTGGGTGSAQAGRRRASGGRRGRRG